MPAFQKSFRISTRGRCHVLDISDGVEQIVSESRVRTGIVNISVKGSTAGITTIEYESGALADFARALERIAPMNSDYAHNARWGDNNGYAHIRSALVGTARSFPIQGGALHTGTWQQVVLCDFDERPREREITVTVIGD